MGGTTINRDNPFMRFHIKEAMIANCGGMKPKSTSGKPGVFCKANNNQGAGKPAPLFFQKDSSHGT